MGVVKHSEFRRGDENRPQRCGFTSTRLNGKSPPGSLSEGAGSPQGLTEEVSSDGSAGPMVYLRFLALKFLRGYVHRSTLPQLRCAQQLPQRGSRGGVRTIHWGAR